MMRTALLLLLTMSAYSQTLDEAERLWREHDYQAANRAFRELNAQYPRNAAYKVRWGRLLLEHWNNKDANDLFQEALAIDPKNGGALLGLALVGAAEFKGSAASLAHRALEADPKLTEAQELLARLALEDNNPKLAREEADRALVLDGKSLEAESIHASADLLEHLPAAGGWLDRMAREHPHNGRGDETVGYFLQLNRRYEDGIAYFRKAIATDPKLWSAHAQLGLNLMRLAREEEARKELELCYANGWRDAQTVNTLRLMDTNKNFHVYRTGTTILRASDKESDELRLYMEPEFERALAVYRKKYEWKLTRPVQLEVYPEHEDFAVRTMGMPGLGALGVTFQDVVAMDSPSGRPPGEFHWAATMWHELSHVYILAITGQRTPRWFTEGVAVHEESQASPDWGDRMTPEVIRAIRDKKLLPIPDLDRGFIHPSYSGQVVISYFQAGKICDFISKKWGEHKLLDMAHAYSATDSTPDVLRDQLGQTPEQFDKAFLAALSEETKRPVENYDKWQGETKALTTAVRAKKWDDAIAAGKAAEDLYPEFPDVYPLVAQAYRAKGDVTAAQAQLQHYSDVGGRDPQSLKDLAKSLREQGKTAESSRVLERLIYIAPLDEALHNMLGEDYLDLNNARGAEREYRALLAGKSPDQAAAHFGLARAYVKAHEAKKAKDEVLLALEAAPGYKPAQKLLLQLTDAPHTD